MRPEFAVCLSLLIVERFRLTAWSNAIAGTALLTPTRLGLFVEPMQRVR